MTVHAYGVYINISPSLVHFRPYLTFHALSFSLPPSPSSPLTSPPLLLTVLLAVIISRLCPLSCRRTCKSQHTHHPQRKQDHQNDPLAENFLLSLAENVKLESHSVTCFKKVFSSRPIHECVCWELLLSVWSLSVYNYISPANSSVHQQIYSHF